MVESILLLSSNQAVVLKLCNLLLEFRAFRLEMAIETLVDIRLGNRGGLDGCHGSFHLFVYDHYTDRFFSWWGGGGQDGDDMSLISPSLRGPEYKKL